MAQQLSNQRIAWFNGKFVPESDVVIPFRDRSWKYGDGAFDMTRTFEGKPFRLKEHIDRFYRSLRYLQIDPGITPKEHEMHHRAQLMVCQRLLGITPHLTRQMNERIASMQAAQAAR